MGNKKGRSRKAEDAFDVAIDCIITDFDHRLNELFSELIQNFSYIEYFRRIFSFETCRALNKSQRMIIF